MKQFLMAVIIFLAFTVSAYASPQMGTCRLRTEPNGQVIVIVSIPCFKRDFPTYCQVPRRITVGQRIYCPVPSVRPIRPMAN